MKKLIIDRRIWLRGEGEYSLLLRESDRKMCCIGILLSQNGVSEDNLKNCDCPEKDTTWLPTEFNWLVQPKIGKQYEQLGHIFYAVNDSKSITDERREEKLTELFKERDIEVEFVN